MAIDDEQSAWMWTHNTEMLVALRRRPWISRWIPIGRIGLPPETYPFWRREALRQTGGD